MAKITIVRPWRTGDKKSTGPHSKNKRKFLGEWGLEAPFQGERLEFTGREKKVDPYTSLEEGTGRKLQKGGGRCSSLQLDARVAKVGSNKEGGKNDIRV